jgi:hypothetical protein
MARMTTKVLGLGVAITGFVCSPTVKMLNHRQA